MNDKEGKEKGGKPWKIIVSTATTLTVVYSVACGFYLHFDGKIHDLKNEQIESAKAEILKREDFAKRFFEAEANIRSLQVKVAELEGLVEAKNRSLEHYLSQKWEEKFNTEKISNNSLREELALAEKRLEIATRQITEPVALRQADIDKLAELEGKIKIVTQENEKFKNLYLKQPNPLPATNNASAQPKSPELYDAKALLASIKGLGSFEAMDVLLSTLPKVQGQIALEDLVKLTQGMASFEKEAVITRVAPKVKRPLSAEGLEQLLKGMGDFERGSAAKALAN